MAAVNNPANTETIIAVINIPLLNFTLSGCLKTWWYPEKRVARK